MSHNSKHPRKIESQLSLPVCLRRGHHFRNAPEADNLSSDLRGIVWEKRRALSSIRIQGYLKKREFAGVSVLQLSKYDDFLPKKLVRRNSPFLGRKKLFRPTSRAPPDDPRGAIVHHIAYIYIL
uniref:Uncharacterized protein n=1 Tax=Romanomermis culicivorax TaxID=13658 RepID=A0A915KPZ4_ROMCU